MTTGRLLDKTIWQKLDKTCCILTERQDTTNQTDQGQADFTKDDLKPGTKITIQPPLQLAEQPQDKKKAEKSEGDYAEPRRGEGRITLEDKMPEDSQEARKAKGLKASIIPSDSERKLYELTHLPYRDWCQHCIVGKGKNTTRHWRAKHSQYNWTTATWNKDLMRNWSRLRPQTWQRKRLRHWLLLWQQMTLSLDLCSIVPFQRRKPTSTMNKNCANSWWKLAEEMPNYTVLMNQYCWHWSRVA